MEIDKEKYLDKFTVHYNPTLFDTDGRDAVNGFCPWCGNKLKEMRSKPLKYCNGKKHRRTFVCKKI